jgi:acyl carrier protein
MIDVKLQDELKTIIAKIIEIDDFNDDDNFATELGVDSMLALEIVARIEKRYRIRIPEEQFAQLQTLSETTRIVSEIRQPVNS